MSVDGIAVLASFCNFSLFCKNMKIAAEGTQ